MCKGSDILDFWKDKAITSKGEICLEKEADYLSTIPAIIDWGEARCFACGLDSKAEFSQDTKIAKHLQKCHIIPKALGGSYEPDNIVLLCKHCHEESPDVADSTVLLKWIYKKRIATKSFLFDESLFEMLSSFTRQHYNDELDIKQIDKLTETCNTHGGGISPGTIEYVLDSIVVEKKKEDTEIVKQKRVKMGRPEISEDKIEDAIFLYLNSKQSVSSIAKTCGISRATIYNKLKERGISRDRKWW